MSITEINSPLYERVGDELYRINLETTAGQVKTADGSDVETRLAALGAAEITALTGRVEGLEAGMETLERGMDTVEAAVATARSAADAAADSAAGLEGRMEAMEAEKPGIVARVDEAEARLEELEANFPIPLPEFNDTITLDDEEKYGVPALKGGIKFCISKFLGAANGPDANYKTPTFSDSNITNVIGDSFLHTSETDNRRLVIDESGLYFIEMQAIVQHTGTSTLVMPSYIRVFESDKSGDRETVYNVYNVYVRLPSSYGVDNVISSKVLLPLKKGQALDFIVYDSYLTAFSHDALVRIIKILSWDGAENVSPALFSIQEGISGAQQLAMEKWIKQQEIDAAIAATNVELTQVSADLLAAMLTPAAMDVEDGAAVISVEDGRRKLLELRAVQADNHALRKLALAAKSLDEIRRISPAAVSEIQEPA